MSSGVPWHWREDEPVSGLCEDFFPEMASSAALDGV